MSYLEDLRSNLTKDESFLDLIFEGRNKSYGAYELRKRSDRRLLLGFLIAVFVLGSAFSIPLIRASFTKKEEPLKVKAKRVLQYSELSAPPPIALEKPPPERITEIKKEVKKFLKPVVKPDEEVIEEELIPTMEELETVEVGTENIEGIDSIALDQGVESFDQIEPEEVSKPFLIVEQMPTYPGGEGELISYLSKTVMYPSQAREFKVQGLVVARFVIESDGSISNIEVLRGIGAGCDEEAVRVIEGIPNWSPGVQNGNYVPVMYTLPIRFVLK